MSIVRINEDATRIDTDTTCNSTITNDVNDNIKSYSSDSEDSADDLFNGMYPSYPTYTPLQNQWVIYYLGPLSKWNDKEELAKIRSVEDFWSIYNNIKTIDELLANTSYMMFKKGIKPCWKSEHHNGGGRWVISMDSADEWLKIMLLMIGGVINVLGSICAKKIIRRGKKMKTIVVATVWLEDLEEKECLLIGEQLKMGKRIHYVKHEDCRGKNKYLTNAHKTYEL